MASKREIVKEAMEELDSMTYDWRAVPDRSDLRHLFEYVYERGKMSKIKKQRHHSKKENN